jgi:hypothetical protein
MYNIKAVIASFLCKMHQNFAQSQYLPIHTTKRRLTLRWENLGTFSQSQPRIYFVKSQNNAFCGVNWKIL